MTPSFPSNGVSGHAGAIHDVIEMRQYADELQTEVGHLTEDARNAAQKWITWIRAHADRLDPRNQTIAKKPTGKITRSDLDPYMQGWGTWRP